MATNYVKIETANHHVTELQKACDWAGIFQGRAAQYKKLVGEFFGENKRSREHILAHNESCEITDIYNLWEPQISRFPGLEKKIKKCLNKGPALREDESDGSSSNRPRNDAFVYILAGKLLKAGVEVIAVDGVVSRGIFSHSDADITIDWNGSLIDIQCKRPQTKGMLEKRVKEAHDQINNPNRPGQWGIIAVDCSVLLRPPGTLLEANSAESAEQHLANLLDREIKPIVGTFVRKPNILGAFLFARVPGMTRVGKSPILSPKGKPFTFLRPDSICSTLVISNANSLSPGTLQSISNAYRKSLG